MFLVDVNINLPPIHFEEEKDEDPVWPILSLFLFLVLGLFGGLFILYLCRRYPSKFTCKFPTFLAIILFMAIFTQCAHSASPRFGYGKKRSKFSKYGKSTAKWSGIAILPPLVYVGIEALMDWLNDPNNSLAIGILAFSVLFVVLLIFIVIYLVYQYNRQKISPANSQNPNSPIELNQLQNAVQELVQRTNPPQISTH